MPYTMTTKRCVAAMVEVLQRNDADKIPGDVVECGVWKGGNVILARKYSPGRVVWAYDTFNGMPPPDDVDGEHAIKKHKARVGLGHMSSIEDAWFGIPASEVRANLAAFGLMDEAKVRIVEGVVERTLDDPANVPKSISLLRLDTDWYSSTIKELEVLYPRLSPGGTLIVDDYGYWRGSMAATNEYFWNEEIKMEWIDRHSIMMKKAA